MKKVSIIIAIISLIIFGLTIDSMNQNLITEKIDEEPAEKENFQFAAENLALYFNKFSDDLIITRLLDSIRYEYPKIMSDINLLKSDSLKNLNIDFVGMLHITNSDNDIKFEKEIKKSQKAVKKLCDTKKYDIIVSENFSSHGEIDQEKARNELKNNVSSLTQILRNYAFILSEDFIDSQFKEYAENDFSYEVLLNPEKYTYFLIGTEPRWVRLTEQLLKNKTMYNTPIEKQEEVLDFIKTLLRTRNEVSLARTAKYLINNNRNQKAVILCDSLHLKEFEHLKKRCGVKGELTNLSSFNSR